VSAEGLRRYLTEASEKQMKALLPKGKASLAQFREVMEPALRVMMADSLPAASDVEVETIKRDGTVTVASLSRKGQREKVGIVFDVPQADWDGNVVLLACEDMRIPGVRDLATKVGKTKAALCSVMVFGGPEDKTPAVNKNFAGYTFGYNRPLVANRAHDVLTAVAWLRGQQGVKSVHLAGMGKTGVSVALARGLCGDAVAKTAVDANGFRFESVKDFNDEMMLPGALKYGGLLTLTAVSAPHELLIHNTKGCGPATYLDAAYEAAGASNKLTRREEAIEPAAVVDWLLK